MSKEILSENLLEELVEKACELENKMFQEEIEQCDHVFSEDYQKKMDTLMGKSSSRIVYRRRRRMPMKYLLAAVLMALMMAITVVAVEPLREKVVQMIEKLFSDHTDISFGETEPMEAPIEFKAHKLKYVPEGYNLAEEELAKEMNYYVCVYTNKEDNSIVYEQNLVKEYNSSITSDGSPARKIDINGKEAYVLKDPHGITTVIYVEGKYVFTILSQEDTQTIVDIFEKNFKK